MPEDEDDSKEEYVNKHQHALYENIKLAIDRTIDEWDNITCTDIAGILYAINLEYSLNNFANQEDEDSQD